MNMDRLTVNLFVKVVVIVFTLFATFINDVEGSSSEQFECIPVSYVNALLGEGNWTQLADPLTNGVVVEQLPDQGGWFLVHAPVIKVDKLDESYLSGEVVPSGGEATVWFENEVGGSCPPLPTTSMSNDLQVGVAHVNGDYHFEEQNFLLEGAERILEEAEKIDGMEFNTIFVYLSFDGNASIDIYPDRGTDILWPTPPPNTLTELAQTIPFTQLFEMPYETYILTTYSHAVPFPLHEHYDESDWDAEEAEFYNLTQHLLQTYAGSGKTFILKHWEGDGIVDNAPGNVQGTEMNADQQAELINWLQARQRGVERARQDVGDVGVSVLNAVEVNRVVDVAEGKRRMINAVIPYVNADMVAYSAWDSTVTVRNAAELNTTLTTSLDTINQYAPDSHSLGNKRIFISEFGLRENSPSLMMDQAVRWCTPYCDATNLAPLDTTNLTSLDATNFTPLIEGDGSENFQGVRYNGQGECIPFFLPEGVTADIDSGETVYGPIALSDVCGASIRVIRNAPSRLTAAQAMLWCLPMCSEANFERLIEADGRENPRGLIYSIDADGECIEFSLPAGVRADIWTGAVTETVEGAVTLPSVCRATLRLTDNTTIASPVWRIEEVLATATSYGLSYATFWQIYDNDCDVTADGVVENSDCDGNWLVRPDGSVIDWPTSTPVPPTPTPIPPTSTPIPSTSTPVPPVTPTSTPTVPTGVDNVDTSTTHPNTILPVFLPLLISTLSTVVFNRFQVDVVR